MRNILVTGANGFIGSRFVELNKDKYAISVLNSDTAEECVLGNKMLLDFWLEEFSPEGVFHFGAKTSTTSKNIQENFILNCMFTNMLIEACCDRDIPLIFSSSASLYGSGKGIPLNLYAWTKWVSESYGLQKYKAPVPVSNDSKGTWGYAPYKWQFTALRYFNVYGIGEHKKNPSMTSLVYQSLGRDKIELFEGKPKRDFVFVDDVVSANIHSFETRQAGMYEVGTGEARTFEDIANCLGAQIEYVKNPIEDQYQFFTQAEKDNFLGQWSPKYSLEDGIKKTREYYGK